MSTTREMNSTNDAKIAPQPRRKRRILILLALFLLAVVMPVFLCGSWFYSIANCDEDGILERDIPVLAQPLLDFEFPENSIPIQNVRFVQPKDAKAVAGTAVRIGRNETIATARASFDELCQREAPWYPYDYDHSQYSFGGSGDLRYCSSHILQKKQFTDSFICDTWGYDSYVVIQNGTIIVTINENTEVKRSHGENTNLAIQTFADDLVAFFHEMDNLDSQSRVIMEVRLLGGNGRDLRGLDLSHTDLANASLSGADLRDSDLTGAMLSGAILSFVDFGGAILKDADLQGAYLVQAKFVDADLENADLSGASLHAANLDGVDLRAATVEGALYNQLTTWPDDFDPEAAGAIFDSY